MAEIALAGALALVDRLVLVYQYVTHDVEEVKKWLDTMKSFLKDIEGREDTEGLKDRVEKVRNLAFETEDAIEEYMFQSLTVVHIAISTLTHLEKTNVPQHLLEFLD
ncbi:hypothetical protein CFP56_027305 [Quercus suber]|uniref:Disease resistance N-terminal domain-containing protein n=1 Tax=Quercus suber TaxID=58331 RepID=A0AAW0LVM3_QUESU